MERQRLVQRERRLRGICCCAAPIAGSGRLNSSTPSIAASRTCRPRVASAHLHQAVQAVAVLGLDPCAGDQRARDVLVEHRRLARRRAAQ